MVQDSVGFHYGGNFPMIEIVKGEKVELYLTKEQINQRVKELATEITEHYGEQPLTVLGTLKGSVLFLADLVRELPPNIEIDFIRASSYGDSSETSGEVTLEYVPSVNLEGRHVLLVEDIIDTGLTASGLYSYLVSQKVNSIQICALLDKPMRRKIPMSCDYLGFSIPNEFVVGYGLDYAQRYRNLPYVGILSFEEQSENEN